MPVKLTTSQLTENFSRTSRCIEKFINVKESEADLSTMRIGQELITNLGPKAVFARGLVDLCDNAFREILENIIVYIGPKIVGENIFRKIYSKNVDKGLNKAVATEASELLKTKNPDNKKLMPIKAAIAVSALVIPLAEYSLSYVKNLFTLKMFGQADFNNIANLNKNQKENVEHQKKVKDSAHKHIGIAGGLFAGCLAFSALLLTKGKNSKFLNSISEAILAPGTKFFKNNEKLKNTVNKYFGLDFVNKNGKLAMSNGQLTASVVVGGVGYFGAAKDRGKQDFKEVLYRFPLVGFYAITGSDLVEKGFKSLLRKTGHCKELLEEEVIRNKKPEVKDKMPKLSELADLAHKLAGKNATKAEVQAKFDKLFKQKATIIGVPFLFGLGVMGFFVAGMSRYFTQYRYNKEMQEVKSREVKGEM